MSTHQSAGAEVHPLVFLGSLLYALLLISLVFLYWNWVTALV